MFNSFKLLHSLVGELYCNGSGMVTSITVYKLYSNLLFFTVIVFFSWCEFT